MASITSLMNSTSSTSSLYGNRNVISGLASGMDTEAMIENSISGYKAKITSLQQKMTKMQWKQDAYRSLVTQMNNILSKYTSYTSNTNLFSSSFFTKAVNTIANGANASAVSATGKSSSNVAINRIKQLAEAASYTVGTDHLVSEGSVTSEIKWDDKVETSAVSGSISLKYGGGKTGKGSTFTLRFSEDEVYHDANELKDAINKKLKDQRITTSSGSQSADNYIKAEVDGDGKVKLVDQKGNYFAITGVTGDMGKLFEKGEADNREISATKDINLTDPEAAKALLVNTNDKAGYLSGQSINVTLDGKTKKISLDFMKNYDTDKKENETKTEYLARNLKEKVQKEFGSRVSIEANGDKLKIESSTSNGSTLKIASSAEAVNKALGLGEGGYSNTLQTSWTLEKVFGKSKIDDLFNGKEYAKDSKGNMKVTSDVPPKPIYIDEDGNETTDETKARKVGYISINGESIELKSTDTVKDMMEKINASNAGVEIKYSNMTGNFAITAKDTGEATNITISSQGKLGAALFGSIDENGNVTKPAGSAADAKANYTKGADAVFTATINGEEMELRRSSNTVDLDGMQVTLKNTFGWKTEKDADGKDILVEDTSAEKITFSTTSDSDKIVDAVKSFIEDYNKMVTEMHNAYRTEALKNSSGKSYEPLTDDDMAGMSESSIKAYEDKAKTGILYGDQDVSNLYNKLTEAVQGMGEAGAMLRSIGLSVEFSNGLSTLNLDEEKFREKLESDPDMVKNAFTMSTANGAAQDGLMAGLKTTLEQYGSTSIANPGILVNKAGSELSSYSLSHNEIQDQMDSIQEQIERWQDKMGDRVDFYTNKFTQLEMLINQMNSQSSMLSGMMGG